jgi:glycosyltransferase involved in cell wall biosynthesis
MDTAVTGHNILDFSTLVDSDLPRISIVVPSTVEQIEEVEQCVETIGQLDYPNFEVLLVDNRRNLPAIDPLRTITNGRSWLRVVRESRPGISAARNLGVAQSDGDIIAFTDDDVRVDQKWLRAIGTCMALNPKLDAVTGLILPGELESPTQIWFERYYGGFAGQRTFTSSTLKSDQRGPRLLRGSHVSIQNSADAEITRRSLYGIDAYGAGANLALRSSAFERISGFNVALGVGTPARGREDLAWRSTPLIDRKPSQLLRI